MFDIGLGEFMVLAVLALLVFGPDQLPKAASSAGKWVRQLRNMADSAKKELGNSADLGDVSNDLKSLRDLHPRRMISSVFDDAPDSRSAPAESNAAPQPVTPKPSTPPVPGTYDPDAT